MVAFIANTRVTDFACVAYLTGTKVSSGIISKMMLCSVELLDGEELMVTAGSASVEDAMTMLFPSI
eukprot:10019658-Ditylum_brightwellii.AAC.1